MDLVHANVGQIINYCIKSNSLSIACVHASNLPQLQNVEYCKIKHNIDAKMILQKYYK
jgi:hypothetical protein